MLQLHFDPEKGVWAEGEDADRLRNNFFGHPEAGMVRLLPEEALYLLDLQNGVVGSGGKEIGFPELLSFYAKENPRLLIKYNAYRDWRDRGLIIRRAEEGVPEGHGKSHLKKYPSNPPTFPKLDVKACWEPGSFMAVIDDAKTGRMLFDEFWIGQMGVYKQERGKILKLNFLETIFLSKHFRLTVEDATTGKKIDHRKIMDQVSNRREFARTMYQAYEEWRLRGYVVKTGFKFGTHFRIYFPGASPVSKEGEWIHSKHVLHIFPKEEKLLISEWARAVRVAHGVKKTFILGISRLSADDYVDYPAEFLAFRRKKKGNDWVRETPKDGPRYLLAAVSEDEHIGGVELASLLKKAEGMDLNLLLSITDRETAITYYALNKIKLKDSEYDYYEIEWFKP